MKKIYRMLLALPLFILAFANIAVTQVPMTTDSRIKTFVYSENEVFRLKLQYGYQSSIEFAKGEEVETLSIGNNYSWKITPVERRLFLIALEGAAKTNMTVITNKRTYQFELESRYPEMNLDEELAYVVRFFYPSENLDKPMHNLSSKTNLEKNDLNQNSNVILQPVATFSTPSVQEGYNFSYSLTGPDSIAPLKVFDDGQFTFMQFPNNNSVVPKLFSVDTDGSEARLKYLRQGEYIVIKQLINKMALRINQDVVFVYSDRQVGVNG
jgi:type IV secretion system protein VirB9